MVAVAGRPLLHARRPVSTAQAYSRYARRFASGLPDWSSSSTSADPAALPSDLPEVWSQSSAHTDPVANAADPVQDGPVAAAVSLIDHLHSVTGLPWWATLSATALGIASASILLILTKQPLVDVPCWLYISHANWLNLAGVRAALFPLAVRQIQATAGTAQIWKQVVSSNTLAHWFKLTYWHVVTATYMVACYCHMTDGLTATTMYRISPSSLVHALQKLLTGQFL